MCTVFVAFFKRHWSLSLTKKQEEFAQQWYATGNKTEAYRRAYNCAGMSESTINKRASELSLDGKIAGRFSELQKAGQEETKTTVRDLDAMLKDAVELAKSISSPSAIVSAVTALAKLHGLNAPDKQHVNHSSSDGSMRPTTIELVPYVRED